METKIINKIQIDKNSLNKLVIPITKQRIKESIKKFDVLKQEIENLIKKSNWIKIGNKDVYYEATENVIVPNLETFICSCKDYINDQWNVFEGFKGVLPTEEQVNKLFFSESKLEKFITSGKLINGNGKNYYYIKINDYCKRCSNFRVFGINRCTINRCPYNYDWIQVPIVNLNKSLSLLELFLQNNIYPKNFSKNLIHKFNILISLYLKGYVKFENENIIETKKFIKDVLNQKFLELNNISFKKEDILVSIQSDKSALDESFYKIFIDNLLNCDKKRADIEPYDIKILEDPRRGHWDLWNQELGEKDVLVETDKQFVARNPLSDINEDGTIAIDFGTKSTIVVSQGNTENIMPIRIGTGNLSKKINSKQYENPTVIEFIDLQDFMKRYNSKNGRPETLWEDLTISHTAFNDLIESDSSEYYSYFYNLKQWAGGKEGKIRIRDKKNFDVVIPSYLELKEEDIDPIEIYAYNLGLYINNMRQGIFLDYILSFPVTYEKAVREKILNSFSKGIKKSLPVEVLNDEDCMKRFRVIQGASEPAAYAVCALQEYNFEPEDDEKIFYGIFDFGGGTTDFDFGIWREANEKESRYDYVINHFGAGGDRYLGGENLLELLAFEVFKENQDKLREKGITFLLPEECERFAGSEVLISESQEAKLNTKQLMEYLRCFWEKEEGYEKKFESGKIKIALFTKDGKREANFELDINTEILETILRNRIEKGVKNFFESLKLAFAKENIKDVKNVLIFLAGNSSKSPIVIELFEKYIKEETEDIIKYNNIEAGEYFKIYPPLGTEEAYNIQEELGIKVCRDDITKPTGKTGVAFGLIDCLPGSNIKVISEKNIEEEIKFKYYIGHNKKRKFFVDINRDVDYNKWILFTDASCEDFQIYYTTEPQASSNNMPINEVKKKKCRIDVIDENANVYVRAVGPSELEYVVANEDEITKNKYISQLVKLKLE